MIALASAILASSGRGAQEASLASAVDAAVPSPSPAPPCECCAKTKAAIGRYCV